MTKQEIEQAANIWDDDPKNCIPIPYLAFIAGAEMVNAKQPYTAEDMKLFVIWFCKEVISFSNDLYTIIDKKTNYLIAIKFDELLKLWEEQSNEQ